MPALRNLFTFLLLSFFSSGLLFAQYQHQWVKGIRSPGGIVSFKNLVHLQDGSMVGAGTFQGLIDLDPSEDSLMFELPYHQFSQSSRAFFLLKLDREGRLLWATQIGDSTNFNSKILALDMGPGGDIKLVGFTQASVDIDPGPGNFDIPDSGGGSFFLGSYSSHGDFNWGVHLNWNGAKSIQSAMQASNGDLLFRGLVFRQTDFDPGPGDVSLNFPQNTSYLNFIWTLKPDGSFGKLWGMPQDMNGNLYAGENQNFFTSHRVSSSFVDVDPNPHRIYLTPPGSAGKLYVARHNERGEVQWVKMFNRNDLYSIGKLMANPDGSCYVVGLRLVDSVDAQNPLMGGYDIAVGKISASGQLEFMNHYGGYRFEGAIDITRGYANDVFVSAYFVDSMDVDPGPGTTVLNAHVFQDWLILQVGPDGTTKSYYQTEATYGTEQYFLTRADDGDLLTYGEFYGTIDFDPGTGVDSLSDCRAFIQKLSLGDLHQEQVVTKSSLSVYPNPGHGEFNITSDEDWQELTLYDATGKQIQRLQFTGDHHKLLIPESPGLYLLRVIFKNGREDHRLILKK